MRTRRLAWFLLLCAGCAIHRLVTRLGDPWTLLYVGLALVGMVLFVLVWALNDDQDHAGDPDWLTMQDAVVAWITVKALAGLFRKDV